jgi:hypothetical protein
MVFETIYVTFVELESKHSKNWKTKAVERTIKGLNNNAMFSKAYVQSFARGR